MTQSYQQFVFQYSQQFATGTSGAFTFVNSRSLLNSSTPLFNPSISGYLDLQINQNLLQGRSLGVNNRNIRVAKNNLKVSNLQVKLQVVTTISAVLNLYWDLVSFNEAVRIKEQALETAQKLFDGNKKQVEIGALAGDRSDARGGGGLGQQRGSADRADERGAAGDCAEERAEPQQHAERLAG